MLSYTSTWKWPDREGWNKLSNEMHCGSCVDYSHVFHYVVIIFRSAHIMYMYTQSGCPMHLEPWGNMDAVLVGTRLWIMRSCHITFNMSFVIAMSAAVIWCCSCGPSHSFWKYTKLVRWPYKKKYGDLSGHSCDPVLPLQWPGNHWSKHSYTDTA